MLGSMSTERTAGRPLEPPEPVGEPRADALRTLIAVVDRLRAPDGCPWDREQTLATLAPHVIEEAFEVVEAIESGDDGHVCEELGDLLMGIVLISRVAEQARRFDLARVAAGVSEKLVRRHPHVFGGVDAADAEAALASWNSVKRAERAERGADASALAGVPSALPALQRARRLAEKAIASGFRWDTPRAALAKLEEELRELREVVEPTGALELAHGAESGLDPAARERAEAELGDLLISGAFLGAYLGLDAERAARAAARRFEARFRHMEAGLAAPPASLSLEELRLAWEAAKRELG